MNSIRNFVVFIFIFGFISSSSSEGNFLLNICFEFAQCFQLDSYRSDGSYLKLIPVNFDPNIYDYTINIPTNYTYYTPTGPMRVEFYVIMNVTNTDDDLNNGKEIMAKSVLFDADEKQVLADSDIAFSSNEMLLISAQISFDVKNEAVTKLVVYKYNDGPIQGSDPYIITFKRSE